MNPKQITLLFVCSILAVLLIAGGMQIMGSQQIDKSSLHQSSEDLLSYSRETILLLNEYQKGAITDIYLKNQSTAILQKSLSFYDSFGQGDVPAGTWPDVKTFEPQVFSYIQDLKQIAQAKGDKLQLNKLKSDVLKKREFFKQEVTRFE